MPPRISVIVPIYKVEPYLRKCVDSILAQTYKNLEVILVDDGSPDGCPAICDEYAAKDSRVKVIHKQNGGLSDARNAGMAIMTGEYVTFVDSDDWIKPEHISLLYALLQNRSPYTIAVSDVQRIDEGGNLLTVFCKQNKKSVVMEPVFGYVWNKLFPKELIQGEYFPDIRYAEDLVFNINLLRRNPEYVYSGQDTYIYLLRHDSILSADISVSKINNFVDFTKKLWTTLCGVNQVISQCQWLYSNIAGNLMCNFLCEITVNSSYSGLEKCALIQTLMERVCCRRIKLKYADNNLLRLAVVSKTVRCPWLFIIVYSRISQKRG